MAHAARLNLRLQKELKLLLSDPPHGVSLPSLTEHDCTTSSLLSSIEARIEGPEGTVYSNGVFAIKIQVPERYPFQPPNVTFVTPIYHPNIDDGGRICLDILNLPPKGAWQPSLNIGTVLTSIGLLLSEPNPDDGLMAEASREYKYNRQVFDQKARSWTEKYAHHGASSNSEDAGPTNTSIIMKSHLQMDTGKMDVKPENAVSDNEGARKKPRTVSEKLQLKTTAVLERKNSDDNENIARARRLSLSSSQKQIQGSSSSLMQQHVTTCKQKCFLEDSSVTLVGNEDKIELAPENIDTIIVSDSEESDDEIERFPRSKLFLMKNQILGMWKNNTCN